jgi:hypothetical protein
MIDETIIIVKFNPSALFNKKQNDDTVWYCSDGLPSRVPLRVTVRIYRMPDVEYVSINGTNVRIIERFLDTKEKNGLAASSHRQFS